MVKLICVHCGARYDARPIRPEDTGKAFAGRYCLECLAARPVLPIIVEVKPNV